MQQEFGVGNNGKIGRQLGKGAILDKSIDKGAGTDYGSMDLGSMKEGLMTKDSNGNPMPMSKNGYGFNRNRHRFNHTMSKDDPVSW